MLSIICIIPSVSCRNQIPYSDLAKAPETIAQGESNDQLQPEAEFDDAEYDEAYIDELDEAEFNEYTSSMGSSPEQTSSITSSMTSSEQHDFPNEAEADEALSADSVSEQYSRPVVYYRRPVVYPAAPVYYHAPTIVASPAIVPIPITQSAVVVASPHPVVYTTTSQPSNGMSARTRTIVIVCCVVGGLLVLSCLFWFFRIALCCCCFASPAVETVYIEQPVYTISGI